MNFRIGITPDPGGSLLQVESMRLPGQKFLLWPMEAIQTDSNPYQFGENLVGAGIRPVWRRDNYFMTYRRDYENNVGREVTTVSADYDSVVINTHITNKSSVTWHYAKVSTCMQLGAAPLFKDALGERTYVFVGGGNLLKVKDGFATLPQGYVFIRNARPVLSIIQLQDIWKVSTQRVDDPCVIVTSTDQKWSLVGYTGGGYGVMGNISTQSGIYCAHSDAWLGDVSPGQTKGTTTVFMFMNKPANGLQNYLAER